MKFIIPDKYADEHLITRRKHPTLPLWIYNYTPEVQYDKLWDEVTMQCRGLILDEQSNIVARPFRKFFNYGEIPVSEIPDLPFTMTEKMDGSLVIITRYNGELIFATRGSFESDQVKYAKEIWFNKYHHLGPTICHNYTYLFELIDPRNKVVVDYQEEADLIALEYTPNEKEDFRYFPALPFKAVKQHFGFDSIEDVIASLDGEWNNREGYVIRFENGYRLKIKSPEYLRLHKIITNTSELGIWEMLRDGQDLVLADVPDEFYNWVNETKTRLQKAYKAIETMCRELANMILELNLPTRKLIAEEVKKQTHSGIIFAMIDGKEYAEDIWKILRPRGDIKQSPFKEKQ
jgi:RNA ligase